MTDEELRADISNLLQNINLSSGLSESQLKGCIDYITARFRTAEAEAYHRGQIDELNRLQVDRQGKILSSDVSQRLAELATSANDTMTDHSQDAAMANDTSAQDDGGKE